MLSDLRFAFRQLTKAPGFTATVVLTLALGIAGCVTMFSVLKATVLRNFGAEGDRRLILLRTPLPAGGGVSYVFMADFLEWERELTSYSALAAHAPFSTVLTGEGEPLALSGYRVTQQWFDAIGCPVRLGRKFLPEETIAGRENVVIISPDLWRRVFGGENVIGRTLQLSGTPHTIVGVAGDEFRYVAPTHDFVVPIGISDATRSTRDRASVTVRALLKPAVSLAAAQAELDVVAARQSRQYPETNKGRGAHAAIFRRYQAGATGPVVWTLFGAVTCVLLIACANVANLLLVRATRRQREISVRTALGASRGRIVRGLLAESLLLALAGGAAGLLLADWLAAGIRSYPPIDTMRMLRSLELDGGVVALAAGLSISTAFLFGLAPAWLASRVDLNESLKQGARGSSEAGGTSRLRRALVIGQVAITMILLAAAGLFLRSFFNRARVDLGFVPEHASVLQMQLADARYREPAQRLAFVNTVSERLRSVPGVTAVGTGSVPMVTVIQGIGFHAEGGPMLLPAEWPRATPIGASPGYKEAMSVRLLQGRFFSEQDYQRATPLVVINDVLARQYFPDTDAVGKRLKVGTDTDPWAEIIGVVAGITEIDIAREIGPQIYYLFTPSQRFRFSFIVRTSGNSAALHAVLKKQVHAVDPELAITIGTLEDKLAESGVKSVFQFHLLTVFSLVALVIATVGIYAVIAYTVSQRTTEIGIRMALGAVPADIAQLVMAQGARLVAAGVALGLLGALASARLIESRLYQVSGRDPLTLAAIVLFFAAIAALACWLPARRATKVNPIVALRAE